MNKEEAIKDIYDKTKIQTYKEAIINLKTNIEEK